MELEIAVQDVGGARVAHAHGADRVELCSALRETGGLTPSAGLVERVAAATPLPVFVLVRPRPGNFVYDRDELALMVRDVEIALSAGARGVVVGALSAEGKPDLEGLARLSAAAGPADVVWHRMVDIAGSSADELVETAHRAGVRRILTSGYAASAVEGVAVLTRMAEAARGRVEIMAGGGVRRGHIPALRATGVDAVHLSASITVGSAPTGPGGGDARLAVTDASTVAAVCRSISERAPMVG